MRVLHVFNNHRGAWGSDKAWDKTIQLSRHCFEIGVFSRDSKSLPPGLSGKVKAFVSGIYAPDAVRAFARAVEDFRPDIVHTHELYPLISPWILPRSRELGVPVVQTCYDYRLTCPIATHFVAGETCGRCVGGHEYWSVLKNCRDNLAESAGYAMRNAVARRRRLYIDNVAEFIVLTQSGREWLMRDIGIDPARITIQPCVVPLPETGVDPAQGDYIAFAGRFASEKGADIAIAAARRAGLPLRLAGNAETHPAIRPGDDVSCVMTRSPEELAAFYRGARMLVVPSIWAETFCIVAAEGMAHGLPVVASRIGALPCTIDENVTGLLFPPGDVEALASAMRRVWDDPELCRRLGAAGRAKVATEFDTQSHLGMLKQAYARALAYPPAATPRGSSAAA